jgi:hypothetical protein
MVKNAISIFSNMISRIHPPMLETKWPMSLELPKLCAFELRNIEALDLALPDSMLVISEYKRRKCKKVTACPHRERKHYAKNMCNNCYHR